MSTSAVIESPWLTSGALARSAGLSVDTLRYYERRGLLPPPQRTRGDHRRYPAETRDRLTFIRVGQCLGLRLEEIKELLDACDHTDDCPVGAAERVLAQRISEVDTQIEQMTALRDRLQVAVTRIRTHGDDITALLDEPGRDAPGEESAAGAHPGASPSCSAIDPEGRHR